MAALAAPVWLDFDAGTGPAWRGRTQGSESIPLSAKLSSNPETAPRAAVFRPAGTKARRLTRWTRRRTISLARSTATAAIDSQRILTAGRPFARNAKADAQRGADAHDAARRNDKEEAYQTLGVEPGADADAVSRAHRTLMKKRHPDQGGSTDSRPASTRPGRLCFVAIAEAFSRGPLARPLYSEQRYPLHSTLRTILSGRLSSTLARASSSEAFVFWVFSPLPSCTRVVTFESLAGRFSGRFIETGKACAIAGLVAFQDVSVTGRRGSQSRTLARRGRTPLGVVFVRVGADLYQPAAVGARLRRRSGLRRLRIGIGRRGRQGRPGQARPGRDHLPPKRRVGQAAPHRPTQ